MNLRELIAARDELEAKIEETRQREAAQVLQEIKEKMATYGITADDLSAVGGKRGKPAKTRAPVAAKYRDPQSGKTWSGRGKAPHWIAGQNREDFAV